jgi:hypothetical protein
MYEKFELMPKVMADRLHRHSFWDQTDAAAEARFN